MNAFQFQHRSALLATVAVTVVLLVAACGSREEHDGISAYLEGTLTVAAEVDSTGDYSGFEIAVVTTADAADLDTLGFAITDKEGNFSMNVAAQERGVYPIEIRRNDRLLARDQYVVADGDSSVLRVEFPARRPTLMIRSQENGAWLAYRNTRALHNQRLLDIAQSDGATRGDIQTTVTQAAQIFWSMNETYGGTVGAELARAESIVMMEGWNDSLVLARAHHVAPDNAGYVSVIQAVRRSAARVHGLDAAVDTLRRRIEAAESSDTRDVLTSELVMAYLDSLQVEDARKELAALQQGTKSETWKSWSDAVLYEVDNLMPGMDAPNATFKDLAERELDLQFFFDTMVLLEFIDPDAAQSAANHARRIDLLKLSDGTNFQVITVSMNRDRVANELYLDNKTTSEAYIVPEQGYDSDIARKYNVRSVPKRFLIHDGRIVAKYSGASVDGIRADVIAVLSNSNAP